MTGYWTESLDCGYPILSIEVNIDALLPSYNIHCTIPIPVTQHILHIVLFCVFALKIGAASDAKTHLYGTVPVQYVWYGTVHLVLWYGTVHLVLRCAVVYHINRGGIQRPSFVDRAVFEI